MISEKGELFTSDRNVKKVIESLRGQFVIDVTFSSSGVIVLTREGALYLLSDWYVKTLIAVVFQF